MLTFPKIYILELMVLLCKYIYYENYIYFLKRIENFLIGSCNSI